MNIEKVRIGEVKSNQKNPRTIRDEKFRKLVESIKNFPEMLEVRPIVVDKDMVVLGGNMRLKACNEAGLEWVYIIKADDLTEAQQKEFIVKDNVNYGEWDYLMLENHKELNDWGMDLPDWAEEDISLEEDDFFNEEFIEEYNNEKTESEAEDKVVYDASYMLLMLEEEDFNFIKKYENQITKATGTENISDAFYQILKRG